MGLQIRSDTPNPAGIGQTLQNTNLDPREKLLVTGMEFSRRLMDAKDQEELYFLLTNDIQALMKFDRSILITHLGGVSRLASAINQPSIEKKSEFYQKINALGPEIRTFHKPLLWSSKTDLRQMDDAALTDQIKEALVAYTEFTNCAGLFILPLMVGSEAVAHLFFEYFDDALPEQDRLLTLLRLSPFFSSAIAKQWLIKENPGSMPLTAVHSLRDKPFVRAVINNVRLGAIIAVCLIALLFVIPFPFTVGGEADIVARDRHLAFCKMEGLVDRILVTEGSSVEKGQVIATLDPTEINYKIQISKKQIEQLTAEIELLQRSAVEDPQKLAESHVLELKRQSATEELSFLNWQKQFLDINAPASGLITTKFIETLIGKKFRAGESFAEIAVPEELMAEILVPEDRIASVRLDQTGNLFLNSDPMTGYPFQVKELAPRAEATQRFGNVYRVRGNFTQPPPAAKVGMKGIGKIDAHTTSLWSIITQRLASKWNHFMLHFS